jgi:hypothetical protein
MIPFHCSKNLITIAFYINTITLSIKYASFWCKVFNAFDLNAAIPPYKDL